MLRNIQVLYLVFVPYTHVIKSLHKYITHETRSLTSTFENLFVIYVITDVLS